MSNVTTIEYEFYISVQICSALFLVFNLFFGFIGNTAIWIAVIRNKSLRTSMGMLVCNLAVTGTIQSVFCVTTLLVFNFIPAKNNVGYGACYIEEFLRHLSGFVALTTIIHIAYERNQAIAKPFDKTIRIKRVKITIPIMWFVGTILSLLSILIFFDDVEYALCLHYLDDDGVVNMQYGVYFTVPIGLIAVCLIVYLYSTMLWLVHKHSTKSVKKLFTKTNKVKPTDPEVEQIQNKSKPEVQIQNKSKHETLNKDIGTTKKQSSESQKSIINEDVNHDNINTNILNDYAINDKQTVLFVNNSDSHSNVNETEGYKEKLNKTAQDVCLKENLSPSTSVIPSPTLQLLITSGNKCSNQQASNTQLAACNNSHSATNQLCNLQQQGYFSEEIQLFQKSTEKSLLKDNSNLQDDFLSLIQLESEIEREKGTRCNSQGTFNENQIGLVNPLQSKEVSNCHEIEGSPSKPQLLSECSENVISEYSQYNTKIEKTTLVGDVRSANSSSNSTIVSKVAFNGEDIQLNKQGSRIDVNCQNDIKLGNSNEGKGNIFQNNETYISVVDLQNKSHYNEGLNTSCISLQPENSPPEKSQKEDPFIYSCYNGGRVGSVIMSDAVVDVYDMEGVVTQQKIKTVTDAPHEEVVGAVCAFNPKNKEKGRRKVEAKTAKTTALAVVCFLICWLPYPTTIIVVYVDTRNGEMLTERLFNVYAMSISLSLVASAINPLVYGILNQQFKAELKKMYQSMKQFCNVDTSK